VTAVATKRYSGTPLPRKLGLRAGQRVLFEHAPPGGRLDVPDGVTVLSRAVAPLDLAWSGLKLVVRREARGA